MELWGGPECTVNRIGDRFRDQIRLTGHHHRIEDLAKFAALGIRKLRYPVLWERVAPRRPDERDWLWSDARLAEIARLGMAPIVGLLHHGSGPSYTALVRDDFVALFADYAAAAAARYPQVLDWTPVNEPLTTARFSALYGLWYPHAQDEPLFWRALLNQVDATRAAMTAIRRRIPGARLIQTEDLGEHFSTPELTSTAAHLNHRRWMTWDLLTGRVTRDHALWPHLDGYGLGDRLRAIADDPCPPDVIGVNHYATSDRFLDHRLDAYPGPAPATGYHDLTARRVLEPPPPGLAGMLRQAWERYRLPLAVTECHLGCTREEQLRWLWQAWQACRGAVAAGVDVRALTAWALLGNVDWNSLITREAGHYEPGAFDVRGDEARPTALARLLVTLGSGGQPAHAAFPTLHGPGWWQRPLRLEHPPFRWPGSPPATIPTPERAPAMLVIAGVPPRWTRALAEACEMRGLPHLIVAPDVSAGWGSARWAAFLDEHRPWAMIYGAVAADRPGHDPLARCAAACADRGVACTVLAHDRPDAAAPGMLVIHTVPESALDDADLADVVRACLDLLVDDERGPWLVRDGVAKSTAAVTLLPERAMRAVPQEARGLPS